MHDAHICDDRLANLLGALALAIADQLGDAVRSATDAGGSMSAALVHLSHAPPGGVEPLRRALNLSHSATVRLIDRLVASDLVGRAPSRGDRRALVLTLTARGRERAAAAERGRLDRLRDLLETTLSPGQRQQLGGLAETMLRAITEDARSLWRICRLCAFDACPDCPVAEAAGA